MQNSMEIYLNGMLVMLGICMECSIIQNSMEILVIGCSTCDKIKVNNWSSYCKSSCPYYFNTDTLKEIFGIKKINKIK